MENLKQELLDRYKAWLDLIFDDLAVEVQKSLISFMDRNIEEAQKELDSRSAFSFSEDKEN